MELVKLNKTGMTSLELVEQINIFRKEEGSKNDLEHFNLLNIIREEFEEEIADLKIQGGYYKDKNGQDRPMFDLTLSQAKQVLVRESKIVRKAVIKYIEELENKIKQVSVPKTYAQALLEAGRLALENETLKLELEFKEQIIEENKPKIEYVDSILSSNNAVLVSQIANDYGLSGKALNKILHDEKLIRKIDEQWILYTDHMNKGYTQSHTYKKKNKEGVEKCYIHTKWTQKGRLHIHSILENRGIKANIDKGGK